MKEYLRYAVYGLIFLVPFIVLLVTSDLYFPYITGKNFAFRIIVELMFASWVLLALIDTDVRPRFSWVLAFFAALLGVMFIADAFGEYPLKSFWSNYERMEGYITLVHLFMFTLVVSSMLRTTKLWNSFFNTTLGVAVALSFYGLAQFLGAASISQGGSWRIEGTLGNSTYMSIYLLFHIFIAAIMFFRTERPGLRYTYGTLVPYFAFLLVQTGTRGTTLGLIGGVFITTLYIALFAKGHAHIRKIAAGALGVLVLTSVLFISFRDSAFVQNDPRLARIADISLEAGSARFAIWSVALEGIKERPILGWGQENFNYVFNTYQKPELYGQEPWFDRVHNIVLDWLVAGGVLGAVAYFGIIAAVLYYAVLRPRIRPREEMFSLHEQALILGLFAAYFVHNLFVFDNLVSYIFFAVFAAFVHSRVATPVESLQRPKVSEDSLVRFALPVGLVVTLLVVYVVNVPGIRAAGALIDALRASSDAKERLMHFEDALSYGSFAEQEVREQMAYNTALIVHKDEIPQEDRQNLYVRAEEEIQKEIAEKPGDARIHIFASLLYRSGGQNEKGIAELEEALALSPQKVQFMLELGLNYIDTGEEEKGLAFLKNAFELVPDNNEVRAFYATAALETGNKDLFSSLITTKEQLRALALTNRSIAALDKAGEFDLLEQALIYRIEEKPKNIQARVNLASFYYEQGRIADAISTVQQAIGADPSFKEQGEQIIEQLRSGQI